MNWKGFEESVSVTLLVLKHNMDLLWSCF